LVNRAFKVNPQLARQGGAALHPSASVNVEDCPSTRASWRMTRARPVNGR
jgi:hypothetical protein